MDLQDQINADALEAQKFTRKHFVVGLDFTSGSLKELESLCDDVEYALRGGKSEENLDLLVRIWGAYLGETMRRHSGGEWKKVDGELQLCCNGENYTPHDRVRRRLTGEKGDFPGYFDSAMEN